MQALLQVCDRYGKHAILASEQASELELELFAGIAGYGDRLTSLRASGVIQHTTVPLRSVCSSSASSFARRTSVSQDSVPSGVVRFKLDVVKECALADAEHRPCGVTVRFHRAFISYAMRDRSEVLRRVQMLAAAGIDYFQDILNLKPGDRWMNEIYRHIEKSDVLLLFWSSAAKKSKWVRLEWRYALEHKHEDAVLPVVIEGPPIVPPPKELAHLHFNDSFLYFLSKSANEA